MPTIAVTMTLIYEPREGIDMDAASSAVVVHMQNLMTLAGIDQQGRPMNDAALPLFWTMALRPMVRLTEVKQRTVIGP